MASKLLNVLNKIENDRQSVIARAIAAGYVVPPNCSIETFASFIQDIEEPSTIYNPGISQEFIYTDEWERPSVWPDTKTILYNTPTDNLMDPYLLVLLKTEDESTVIPKSQTLNNNTAGQTCVGWGKVLTSDGVSYTTYGTDITHTWDTSQDIVVDSGEYAGRYRYIIYYTGRSNTTAESTRTLAYKDMVEVIGITPRRASTYRLSFPTFFYNGNNLLNIDYSDTEEYTASASMTLYNGGPYISAFNNLYFLKKITITNTYNKILFYSPGSTPTLFKNCYHLKHIDWGHITQRLSGSTTVAYDLSNCYSLLTFNSPIFTQSSLQYNQYTPTIILGYNPYLEEVKVNLGSNYTENASCNINVYTSGSSAGYYSSYVPTTCRFIGSFHATDLPQNWNGHSYFGNYLYSNYSYVATQVPTDFINALNINREQINVSNCTSFSNPNVSNYSVFTNTNSYLSIMSYSVYQYGPLITFEGDIIFPEDVVTRLDLSNIVLRRHAVLLIIDKLKDLSNEPTTYNPIIKLHWYTKTELLDSDIQLLLDKGWTVN